LKIHYRERKTNEGNLWKRLRTPIKKRQEETFKQRERDANTLLYKFLPDDHIAHDSAQQKNTRTKVAGSETPAAQTALNFMDYEVTEVIEKLQDKKYPRPDGIDGTVVKGLHRILPTLWSILFNTCFKLGCFPKAWKRARVIPIPKTNKRKLHMV
jgi:hypothetical protein